MVAQVVMLVCFRLYQLYAWTLIFTVSEITPVTTATFYWMLK